MSKQRYYAHTLGSQGDGSIQHVVMDRESAGGFHILEPGRAEAEATASRLNGVCTAPGVWYCGEHMAETPDSQARPIKWCPECLGMGVQP